MAYIYPNYSNKASLNAAIKNGAKIRAYTFSPTTKELVRTGELGVIGPHKPKRPKWYANVVVKNGFVARVV